MNEAMKTADSSEPSPISVATTAIDRVCGMTVTAQRAAGSYEYEGVTYYFCSTDCLNKFKANPQAYLNQPPQPMTHQHTSQPIQLVSKANALPVMTPSPTVQAVTQTAAEAGAKYICPMDADVVSDKPGACPKCGMALEPEMPAAPLTKIEYTCPML